jgi:hypothetical protein
MTLQSSLKHLDGEVVNSIVRLAEPGSVAQIGTEKVESSGSRAGMHEFLFRISAERSF